MSEFPTEPTDTHESLDLLAPERLIAVERRWLVLDVLEGQTTPVELEELAAGIAAREGGSDAADEKAIERAAITLHHTHLPKLADLGVLNYDPESRWVEPDGVPPQPDLD